MKDLLIDLDNTIYCEDSKIFSQIDFKMKTFIASKLQLSLEEAYLIQKKYFKKLIALREEKVMKRKKLLN